MPSSLDHLEEAIRKLQDMYDDPDIVIPASQLPEKPNPYKAFMDRNPQNKADGGMLVKPSADGSRPGYAKEKKPPVGADIRKITKVGDPNYGKWAYRVTEMDKELQNTVI